MEQPSKDQHTPVEVVEASSGFSRGRLLALLEADLPVVLRGLFAHQRMHQWTLDTLCESLGDHLLDCRFQKRKEKEPSSWPREGQMRLEEVLEEWRRQDASHSVYVAGAEVRPVERLTRDFSLAHFIDDEERKLTLAGLWLGREPLQHSQCHFDCAHNLLCVIQGTKHVLLASPKDFRAMATYSSSSRPNGFPDSTRDYYRFTSLDIRHGDPALRPRLLEATLERGDALLIPIGWFHDVQSSHAGAGFHMAMSFFWHESKTDFRRHAFLRMFETEV